MERYRFGGALLLALAAWPLTGMSAGAGPGGGPRGEAFILAQALEPACVSSPDVSPGTMTPLGFPCPEGTVPANAAETDPPVARPGDMAGAAGRTAEFSPLWVRNPTGVAGVSGSSRMSGEEKAGEAEAAPGPAGIAPARPR